MRLGDLVGAVRIRAIERVQQLANDLARIETDAVNFRTALVRGALDGLASDLGHDTVIRPSDVVVTRAADVCADRLTVEVPPDWRTRPAASPGAAGPRGSAAAIRAPRPAPSVEGIDGPMQRVLDALAELEQLGATTPAREMVALLAGYTHLQSKGFVNAIGALRTAGRIDYPRSGEVQLTEAGRALARPPEAPRTSAEIQERVCSLLGGASARILRPLVKAYPVSLPRAHVAAVAGYGHLQSKGFVNALGRLRTLGFVEYPDRGHVRAAKVLFLEG